MTDVAKRSTIGIFRDYSDLHRIVVQYSNTLRFFFTCQNSIVGRDQNSFDVLGYVGKSKGFGDLLIRGVTRFYEN